MNPRLNFQDFLECLPVDPDREDIRLALSATAENWDKLTNEQKHDLVSSAQCSLNDIQVGTFH